MRILLLSVIIAFSGCADKTANFETLIARGKETELRSFIAQSSDTDHIHAARVRLAGIIYNNAANATGIAPLITFLNEFGRSPFAGKAKELLAERRAIRAIESNQIWPLMRFLHIHADSPSAKKIRSLLETRWFNNIKKDSSPLKVRKYIDFFPDGKFRVEAIELLAELEYKALGSHPHPAKLRQLAIAFPDTIWGKKAALKIQHLIDMEQILGGSLSGIQSIIEKKRSFDKAILKYALNKLLKKAIYNIDIIEIRIICRIDKSLCNSSLILAVEAWNKLSPTAIKNLRQISVKAAPFAPTMPINSLEIAMDGDDLLTSWTSMTWLSSIHTPRVFYMLLERTGSIDPAIAWGAENALIRWIQTAPFWATQIINIEYQRLSNNLHEVVNTVKLNILSRALKRKSPVKVSQLYDIKYDLETVEMLVLSAGVLSGFVTSTTDDKLRKLFGREFEKLSSGFPSAVNRENYLLARKLARRCWILHKRIESVYDALSVPSDQLKVLRDQVKSRFSLMNSRLSVMKNWVSPDSNPVEFTVNMWNRNRIEAINKLEKGNITRNFWKEFLKSNPVSVSK
ncbi:hypothetical protein KKF34_15390 [Myxococcota bacterium]|nr:hypothetical protein [Myxococcota bacterium]MBU1383088.1 hypothetical protein [Myxococcota bacterium]MBU1498261.1 hypothetical protein [Myxococcota bacterium]